MNSFDVCKRRSLSLGFDPTFLQFFFEIKSYTRNIILTLFIALKKRRNLIKESNTFVPFKRRRFFFISFPENNKLNKAFSRHYINKFYIWIELIQYG